MVETLLLKDLEKQKLVTIGRGRVISKTDITKTPGAYPVYSSSAQGDGVFGEYGEYMFDDERITWSIDGGGRLFYRPAHRYSVTNVSGWIKAKTNKLSTKYLYYCLTAQWALRKFDYTYKAHPSVIREIYQIRMLDIKSQELIVQKLEKLEDIISIRTKQLKILDDLTKARFVEMFGGKDIDVISIGDAVELINGRAFKPTDWAATGLPIIRIQNLNDKAAPFNYYDGAYDKKNYVQKGELLFSWSGTPGTSFGAFIWDRGPGILNQHIFRVLPRIDLDLNYLRYALNDQLEIIISKAHGGVGLQHITKGELEKVLIPSPNKKQQLGFSTFVAQVDKSKFAVEHIPITLEGPS